MSGFNPVITFSSLIPGVSPPFMVVYSRVFFITLYTIIGRFPIRVLIKFSWVQIFFMNIAPLKTIFKAFTWNISSCPRRLRASFRQIVVFWGHVCIAMLIYNRKCLDHVLGHRMIHIMPIVKPVFSLLYVVTKHTSWCIYNTIFHIFMVSIIATQSLICSVVPSSVVYVTERMPTA